MPDVKLLPPERGVANNAPFILTPGVFTAPGCMRNVRRSDRGWEQRPGVEKVFPQRGGDGTQPWQDFTVVEQATGQVGFEADVCAALAGGSHASSGISGHAWAFEPNLCFIAGYKSSNAPIDACYSCAWHPTLPYLCSCAIKLDANANMVSTATMHNALTGAQLWTADIQNRDPGTAIPRPAGQPTMAVNSVEVSAQYVFVTAAQYVFVFKTSDGTYLKRYNCSSWAAEAQCARVRPDGRLAVGFTGTGLVGVLPNQPGLVWTSRGAAYFRSGVMLFDITANEAAPLVRTRYGPGLASADPWFETDHGYHRIAEWSSRKPRGAVPWGMAVGPDNSVVVGMMNAGWGPDVAHKPDGSTGYYTVYKIGPTGAFAWEAATDLILEAYDAAGTTVYNDIPSVAPPQPGITCVAVDAAGDVYAAGRRSQAAPTAGFNVFKLRGADGSPAWRANVSGFVYQNGIAVDPTDGNPVVVFERNSSWTGSGGHPAHLVKLNRFTGQVLDSFDLGSALISYGLAISSSGRIGYVTDLIP